MHTGRRHGRGGRAVPGDDQFLRDLYNLKYLFGDKWAPAINVTLSHGPTRRAEILSTTTSYSPGEEWSGKPTVLHDSILTRALRKMTEEDLLMRTRNTSTFRQVFYSLAPEVTEFIRLVEPLVDWVRRALKLIAPGAGIQPAPRRRRRCRGVARHWRSWHGYLRAGRRRHGGRRTRRRSGPRGLVLNRSWMPGPAASWGWSARRTAATAGRIPLVSAWRARGGGGCRLVALP